MKSQKTLFKFRSRLQPTATSKKEIVSKMQHLAKAYRALCALCMLSLLTTSTGNAQTYATNQGGSNNVFPFGSTTSNKVQWMYLASDFLTPMPTGQITKVYFRTQSGTYNPTYTNLNIRIGSTSLTGFPSTTAWITGLTTVAAYSTFTNGSTGPYTWWGVTFQTPYNYTAGDNLVVEIEQAAYTSGMTTNCQAGPGGTTRRLWGAYGSSAVTGSATGSYGDIAFDMILCQQPSGLNATSITSNSATVGWSAASGSVGYEYAVTTSATPPASGTPTTSPGGSAIGLTSSTTYYLHVRNNCGTSYSSWATYSFTTAVNPCPYPTGVIVSAPTATSATFTWSPVAGSLGYEYIVNQVAATPIISGTPTATPGGSASGLVGGGTYYLHVRNQCSSTGGTWSDWNSVQFIMPRCDEPVNILFSNITGTDVDVIWSLMAAANYYEYQVDQVRADPTGGGSGFNTTTAMNAHISALSPNNKYYVHIRSRCFVSDSSIWALDSFVTTALCSTPIPNVNNQHTSSPDAFWDAVPTALSYEWAYSTSSTHPAFGSETFNLFTPVMQLPLDGKDYYLHVRAKCNSMFEFSNWATVPLRLASASVSGIGSDDGLSIYPNPAGNSINVEVLGGGGATGKIILCNVVGQHVLETVAFDNTQLDITSLPKGVYIVRYESGDKQLTGRFVKN